MRSRKRLALIAGFIALWVALSACSCGTVVDGLQSRLQSTATPSPTIAIVTRTPVPVPTIDREILPEIPDQPGGQFILDLTEDELAERLSGQTFSNQQVKVRDVSVRLTPEQIVVTLEATQTDLGVALDVTLRGRPVVVDQTVYLQVDSVDLDGPLPGFARSIARAAIENLIAGYATPQGIPIPVQEVDVHEVELMDGAIRIIGQRR
ncbi:MAG TPA: hypothetical protein GX702_08770 [Chloroflexi bacterium]|nr:hypothetical protein [Chloroflexota bacterium]